MSKEGNGVGRRGVHRQQDGTGMGHQRVGWCGMCLDGLMWDRSVKRRGMRSNEMKCFGGERIVSSCLLSFSLRGGIRRGLGESLRTFGGFCLRAEGAEVYIQ
jgi:hypothetical protein